MWEVYYLVELQQQKSAGPAGVVKGEQEDAEHPRGAGDYGWDHAPQPLVLIMHLTASGPVWKHTHITGMSIQSEYETRSLIVIVSGCRATHTRDNRTTSRRPTGRGRGGRGRSSDGSSHLEEIIFNYYIQLYSTHWKGVFLKGVNIVINTDYYNNL